MPLQGSNILTVPWEEDILSSKIPFNLVLVFGPFVSIFALNSFSEVAQSCPTLCDPMGCSPPGSSVHEILQARELE